MSTQWHNETGGVTAAFLFEAALTKRSERLAELSPLLEWTGNIWMGVSVENKDYVHRVNDLRKTGAKIKFLSVEPLLGPLPKMNLRGINWVIVGGESGPGARPLEREWVGGGSPRSVREGESSVLFQAMGRCAKEESREAARWQDVGRYTERVGVCEGARMGGVEVNVG